MKTSSLIFSRNLCLFQTKQNSNFLRQRRTLNEHFIVSVYIHFRCSQFRNIVVRCLCVYKCQCLLIYNVHKCFSHGLFIFTEYYIGFWKHIPKELPYFIQMIYVHFFLDLKKKFGKSCISFICQTIVNSKSITNCRFNYLMQQNVKLPFFLNKNKHNFHDVRHVNKIITNFAKLDSFFNILNRFNVCNLITNIQDKTNTIWK